MKTQSKHLITALVWLALATFTPKGFTQVVTSTADSGFGTLRQAITTATNGAVITFATNLSGQTILLASTLTINTNLTIDASALPGGIQISGNGAVQVFNVASGTTVALNSLTITNGHFSGFSYGGGGVGNQGRLTLNECTLTGNSALVVAGAFGFGGGVYNGTVGTLTVNQCTLAGNNAQGTGGAIYNAGTININQSTLAGNSASGSGSNGHLFGSGGIYNLGTQNLFNSIVAGNSGSSGSGSDIYNLGTYIFNTSGANIVLSASASPSGPAPINSAPQLQALGNYGGPTQTMPPLTGSPAINEGSNAATNTFATDQRGLPRLTGPYVDIGSVEYQASPVVTNTSDLGPGSLRDAITATTNGTTITFAPNLSGQTILLASSLTLDNSPTIDASALPGGIQISGNHVCRIFQATVGNVSVLTALKLINGNGSGSDGGAIFNQGSLILNQCTVSGNSVSNNAGSYGGGGICNLGTLNVNNSTLSGNSVWASGRSQFGVSTASGYGGGGAIYNAGTLSVNQCTLSGNFLNDSDPGGTVLLSGGGILCDQGSVALNQSTLSGNSATNPFAGAFGIPIVGGIENFGSLTLSNAIVAGNSTDFGNPNLDGSFTGANNLTAGVPLLAPLGNYGGPTPTMPPLPGSPAIAAGSRAGNLFTADQRGYPRTQNGLIDLGAVELPTIQFAASPTNAAVGSSVQFTGPAADSNGSTINQWNWNFGDGSTGILPSPSHIYPGGIFYPSLIVTNSLGLSLAASGPAIKIIGDAVVATANDAGAGSLRQAIANAYGGQRIIISTNLSGQTFLVQNTMTLANNLTIDASALPGGLPIQGNGSFPIFNVAAASTNVLISLIITNGFAIYGGGIYNEGNLTVIQCTLSGNSDTAVGGGGSIYNNGIMILTNTTLSGNSAVQYGGGIYNDIAGTMVVNQCTLTNNSSGAYGGGIYNEGNLTVNQCTLTNNSSGRFGGGIYNDGNLTVNQCTLAGNSATFGGGGIDNDGNLTVNQCTLAGNSATEDGGGIYNDGNLTVNQCTLAGNSAGFYGGGISNDGTLTNFNSIVSGNGANGGGDIVISFLGSETLEGSNLVQNVVNGGTVTGPPALTAAANLAPLGNYGGPTQTMPPLPGSPAIGAGSLTGNTFTYDQRGFPRTQNGLIDIGAVELITVQPFTASPISAPVGSAMLFYAAGFDSGGDAITQWNWNFGDGFTSTNQNPIHAYNTPDTFTPTLTVTNSLNLWLNVSGPTITMYDTTVNFTVNPINTVVGVPVQFNCPSVDSASYAITQWYWDFGDGATSTDQNPSHIYNTVGNFTPTLYATNDLGGNVITHGPPTITNSALTALYSAVATTVPLGVPVHFNGPRFDSAGKTLTQWNWNFGDNEYNNSTLQNPSYIYTSAGIFAPTLSVINNLGVMLTATGPNITVLTASFTAVPTTVPVGLSVQFYGTNVDSGGNAITQWNWNFGDGATSTLQNPSHIYHSAAIFTPTLSVTNTLGLTLNAPGPYITTYYITARYTASTNNAPVDSAVLFSGPNFDNAGNAIRQWNWNFGDGATSPLQNPSHSYSSAGTFTPTLIVTNSLGLAVNAPGPSINSFHTSMSYNAAPTSAPVGSTVQFNAASQDSSGYTITQWNWNFGDGATSTLPNPSHNYSSAGTFFPTLIGTNSLGAMVFGDGGSGSAITIFATTAQYTATPTSVPLGSAVQFNGPTSDSSGKTITQWNWYFGDGGTSTNQNPSYIYSTPTTGTPTLTVTNSLGSVIVATGPYIKVLTAGYNVGATNVQVGLAVQFNGPVSDTGGNAITQWNWSFGDGATSTSTNPTHYYSSAGTFAPGLIVTNSLGLALNAPGPLVRAFNTSLPYTATPTNVPVGLAVQFNSASFDSSHNAITRWNWSFGDGATSILQNPSHIYSSAGNFPPILYATNSLGAAVLGIGPAIMTFFTTVAFTVAPAIVPVGSTVRFNCTNIDSGGYAITSWNWSFGDGATSTLPNPTHAYTNVGSFTPALIVTNSLGSEVVAVTGPTITTLTANFTATPTNVQMGLPVQFNAPNVDSDGYAIINWNWNFGDGWTSTLQNPVHAYSVAGNFTPTLVVTNNLNLALNASGPAISALTASYTAAATNVPVSLGVQFYGPSFDNAAHPIIQWNWNFGDGATSTDPDPVHAYASVGTFSPTLSVANASGLTLNALGPSITTFNTTANYYATPAYVEAGFPVQFYGPSFDSGNLAVTQWNWDFGDGGTSTLQNPAHVYYSAGTATATLIVTNSLGSAVVASGPTINIWNTTVQYTDTGGNFLSAPNPTSVPVGSSVQFNSPSADSGGNAITQWNWNFGDGLTSLSQNPSHVYSRFGNFLVSLYVKNNLGHTIIASGPSPINAYLAAHFDASANVAPVGASVQFFGPSSDTGGNFITRWNWNFGDGATSTNQSPIHAYSVAGDFAPMLVVTNFQGNFPGMAVNASGPSITVSGAIQVTNGAPFQSAGAVLGGNGTSNNTAVVSGAGSLWTSTGDVVVGQTGSSNQLLVTNGGVMTVTGNLTVGSADSSNNLVQVSNGTLIVTNSSGTGTLTINNGSLLFGGGTLIVNELIITNASGSFTFSGGVLEVTSSVVSNGVALTIGDGTDTATFTLEGGTNFIENGFSVSSNAMINGSGTVVSPAGIAAYGTVSPGHSPGQLVLNGNVRLQGIAYMEIDKPAHTNDLISGVSQLTYGGTLQISLLNGTMLASGDSLRMFSASNYMGTFSSIIPPTPGAGLIWNTQALYTNGLLTVVAVSTPALAGASLIGNNLTIVGSNGVSGVAYHVLMSTNLTLPQSQWTPTATSIWSGNGGFTFTLTNAVNPSLPKRFYLLQVP